MRRATIHFDNYNLHCVISIHALLAESDNGFIARSQLPAVFLSTLSLRRATRCQASDISARRISIHALLAESDNGFIARSQLPAVFLSTLSLRRATRESQHRANLRHFYPRSPCGERHGTNANLGGHRNFYPRSPCGERRYLGARKPCNVCHFYPRSPCGERLCV